MSLETELKNNTEAMSALTAAVLTLVNSMGTPAPAPEKSAPEKSAKPELAPEKPVDEKPAEITIEQVRAALKPIDREVIVDALGRLGAKRLPEVKPADYGRLIDLVEELTS